MTDSNQSATTEFPTDKKLFCFGFGYTAAALSAELLKYDWDISGTTTDIEKISILKSYNIDSYLFDRTHPLCSVEDTLADVTHILLSIPPSKDGDVAFELHGREIAALPNLEWVGYLSTISVYGNYDGAWIDESTPPAPISRRGSLRLQAERKWLDLFYDTGFPLHIFRLAGIYGTGRSSLDVVRSGKVRRIVKKGHVFNRVHIADIIQTLKASILKPNFGEIYNVADDSPAPSHEVIKYACNLLNIDVPPLIPYEEIDYLAPIVRSFYQDNKRVKNNKIKDELGVELLYPDYKSGLDACLACEAEESNLIYSV